MSGPSVPQGAGLQVARLPCQQVRPSHQRPDLEPGGNRHARGLDFDVFSQIWQFASHLYPENRAEMQQIRQAEELPEIPLASPPPIYLTKAHF